MSKRKYVKRVKLYKNDIAWAKNEEENTHYGADYRVASAWARRQIEKELFHYRLTHPADFVGEIVYGLKKVVGA